MDLRPSKPRFWLLLGVSCLGIFVILSVLLLGRAFRWGLPEPVEPTFYGHDRPRVSKIKLVEQVLKVRLRKSRLTLAQIQQLIYLVDVMTVLDTRRQTGWGLSRPLRVREEVLPFTLLGRTEYIRTSELTAALRRLKRPDLVVSSFHPREYRKALHLLKSPAGLFYQDTKLSSLQLAFVYLAAEEQLTPTPLKRLLARLKLQFISPAKVGF